MQWFLKMQHFGRYGLPPVMNDDLKFTLPNIKIPIRTGWRTSRTGVSAASCGGDTTFLPYFLPEGGYVVAATPRRGCLLKLAQKRPKPAL